MSESVREGKNNRRVVLSRQEHSIYAAGWP